MISNELIKKIATELEKEANKSHVFRDKLIGNVIRVPVLKNPDSVTVAASDTDAFSLKAPISLTFRDVKSTQYLARLQILKSELTEGNIEEVMRELASSLKGKINLRDTAVTYGPIGRLMFRIPGRSIEEYLLETSDELHYELRAYADIAVAVKE